MVDRRVIREWLDKADEDFLFAEYALRETGFFSPICFHFQQAAEKYLKAFTIAKELPFRKVHSLAVLLETCKDGGLPADAALSDAVNYLDSCYVDTRYPVHWPGGYTKEKAEHAKEAAARVREAVYSALGPSPAA